MIAENYFSSIGSPSRRLIQDNQEIRQSGSVTDDSDTQDWDSLSEKSREKLLDERLIDNLNGYAKPKPQKYHTLGHNSRRRSSRKENLMQTSMMTQQKSAVRLSTFGVEQVFPRLKIDTGQKEVTVQEVDNNGFHRTEGSTNNEQCVSILIAKNYWLYCRFRSPDPNYLSFDALANLLVP